MPAAASPPLILTVPARTYREQNVGPSPTHRRRSPRRLTLIGQFWRDQWELPSLFTRANESNSLAPPCGGRPCAISKARDRDDSRLRPCFSGTVSLPKRAAYQ